METISARSMSTHTPQDGGSSSYARQPRVVRALSLTAGLAVGLFIFGFVVFATNVMRAAMPSLEHADGIIVLTGGDFRILEGAKVLQSGLADRLLISGVNAGTTKDDLMKLSGLTAAKFACCVDLGYAAQDTVGNAKEARGWATGRKASRLIVVTSSYHMPRSLAELALAMPNVELLPHAVVPRKFRDRAWWLHPTVARVLLSEYVKYLPVAVRLSAQRYMTPVIATSTAADVARPLGQISKPPTKI
jgi:uncharacterized SAM-binding protein YcdF (DUF218 family)